METMSVESLFNGAWLVVIALAIMTLWSCRDSLISFWQAPHFDQLRYTLFYSLTSFGVNDKGKNAVDEDLDNDEITSSKQSPTAPLATGSQAGTPDTYQTEPGSPVPVREPVRLADHDIISELALVKSLDTDEWRFSANKIAELVGGTRADVLAQIRSARDGAVVVSEVELPRLIPVDHGKRVMEL